MKNIYLKIMKKYPFIALLLVVLFILLILVLLFIFRNLLLPSIASCRKIIIRWWNTRDIRRLSSDKKAEEKRRGKILKGLSEQKISFLLSFLKIHSRSSDLSHFKQSSKPQKFFKLLYKAVDNPTDVLLYLKSHRDFKRFWVKKNDDDNECKKFILGFKIFLNKVIYEASEADKLLSRKAAISEWKIKEIPSSEDYFEFVDLCRASEANDYEKQMSELSSFTDNETLISKCKVLDAPNKHFEFRKTDFVHKKSTLESGLNPLFLDTSIFFTTIIKNQKSKDFIVYKIDDKEFRFVLDDFIYKDPESNKYVQIFKGIDGYYEYNKHMDCFDSMVEEKVDECYKNAIFVSCKIA